MGLHLRAFQGCRPVLCAVAAVFLFASTLPGCAVNQPGPRAAPGVTDSASQAVLDELEERTFRYFWETANPANGLVPDRYPSPSFSSIAAVGFGLTAYGIGVERGYVSREAARARVLTTLRFFLSAPQGPEAHGMSGHHGFFYHFLDMKSGQRFKQTELSTIDTTLLLGGVLFAQSYFDGADPEEVELRKLADELYRRVDWRWAQARPPAISHGWSPEEGFLPYDWIGYNEGMLLVLLALGSPTHPVEPVAWQTWTSGYERDWGSLSGQEEHLRFAPHFGHQYSHVWVDFRGIQDGYMRGRGIDYFENSRRATYSQRAYAIANPKGWKGYGQDIWGLTACDGPTGYSARGPGFNDDGTLAPTAAAASIPFAPELAIPAVVELRRRYGQHIYSQYGFLDSFNPSVGWMADDYLGIDQGPIIAMLENHRSQLVWRVMRKNPYLRAGLERAGFQGGWLKEKQ